MAKKFTLLLTLIIALALLVGCQATPEEATEEPDTEAVTEETGGEEAAASEEEAAAEEVAETEAEGEEAAAEGEASEETAAQEGGKWCAGTDIVFFPGGPEGGPFATVVYNGALQAEETLGANVEYVWSDWNPEQMVTQLGEAIATNPDGIAIMGHPGDDAYGPLVEEAVNQGIIVTSQNTTLPELEAQYATSGFGYVGAELYDAGYSLGTEAVSRFELQEGERAMVWGLLAQAGRGQRTQGVIDALEEAGLTVDYLEIDDATNAEAAAGVPTFVGYVSANPDVRLVVTDHGALTATLETYLTSADMGPDDIYAAGFDLSPATVDAIRGGWTDLVIDQQPWLQGYLPILQICLTNNYLFTGLHINTGAGFAHADNIDMLADLVEQQIR